MTPRFRAIEESHAKFAWSMKHDETHQSHISDPVLQIITTFLQWDLGLSKVNAFKIAQEGKVLHSILQFVYMKIYKVLVYMYVMGSNRTNLNAFIFNDSSILFLSNYKGIYNMQ